MPSPPHDGPGSDGPPGATRSGADDPSPSVGLLLAGRYRLVRSLASGGMAEVWEAHDEVLSRRVAVKILHRHLATDDAFVARFRAEAVAAARLSHPAIVSVYDTVHQDDLDAIVMELVRGTTLRARLDRLGRLAPEEAALVATRIAEALGAAHQAGLVHRDVKPANVLLSDDGRVLVTDFGIAKASSSADHTLPDVLMGTVKYVAPEQVQGERADGRADLYALGVVLYEMLVGDVPFHGDTDVATALARLTTEPSPPSGLRPEVPPALDAVVATLLARDRAHRYATADEVVAALRAAREQPDRPPAGPPGGDDDRTAPHDRRALAAAARAPTPAAATPTATELAAQGRSEPAPPPRKRRWPLVATAATVVVALVVGAVVLLARDGNGSGAAPAADTTTAPTGPVPVARLQVFDPPPGDGRENDADLVRALDGDPTTFWRTDTYKQQDIRIKPGVGLVVSPARAVRSGVLVLDSPSTGWSADVYTAAGAQPTDLAGWGRPVGRLDRVGTGSNRVELGGGPVSSILVWITRMGDDGRVEVAEVSLQGR